MEYPKYYFLKRLLAGALLQDIIPSKESWRGKLLARLRHYNYREFKGYYSQYGQDKFLNDLIFARKERGCFVDIGANDGVRLSNSLYFERHLEWTGICVEPNPMVAKQLRENRRCDVVEGCASENDGNVEITVFEGELSVFSGERAKRNECSAKGRRMTVRSYEVNSILSRLGARFIDFISIDIEGGELALFSAIDLGRFRPSVVCLEENEDWSKMDKEMHKKHYKSLGKVGSDRIYIGRDR